MQNSDKKNSKKLVNTNSSIQQLPPEKEIFDIGQLQLQQHGKVCGHLELVSCPLYHFIIEKMLRKKVLKKLRIFKALK